MKKYLCNQSIKELIDEPATNRNKQILESIKILTKKYKVEIVDDKILANDYKIITDELTLIDKDNKRVIYYDTLDDEFIAWLYKDSTKKLSNKKFLISKIDYFNQLLSDSELIRIQYSENEY